MPAAKVPAKDRGRVARARARDHRETGSGPGPTTPKANNAHTQEQLEALKGDRKGQHSIRINDQWRVCFTWKGGDAHDVEIVDYH